MTFCSKCGGSGRLEYEITFHGERNQRVMDNCNKCGGSGKAGPSSALPSTDDKSRLDHGVEKSRLMQRLRRIGCWWRYYHRKTPEIGKFRYDQSGICCDCGKVGDGVQRDGE